MVNMKMKKNVRNLKFRRKVSVLPLDKNWKRFKKLTEEHLYLLALRINLKKLKISNLNFLEFKHINHHRFNKNHSNFNNYLHSISNLMLQMECNLEK